MLRLFSPAKINLFLKVVAKRPDGYHDLSSVFQTISLGDFLTFQLHSRDLLTCSDPSIPSDTSNLILKAVHLFRRKTGLNIFFKTHLDKRIPIQAGLGGGSSNAATTLWACSRLAGCAIPSEELGKWGAEIGSDIPFFFSQGTAHCTGRGEKIQQLEAQPSRAVWIVKPPFGLSTPDVYRRVSLEKDPISQCSEEHLEEFIKGRIGYFNDLENPAFQVRPELKELKQSLIQQGFETVLMTGSGSALFCFGQGKVPTQTDVQTFFARFINRSAGEWYREKGLHASS